MASDSITVKQLITKSIMLRRALRDSRNPRRLIPAFRDTIRDIYISRRRHGKWVETASFAKVDLHTYRDRIANTRILQAAACEGLSDDMRLDAIVEYFKERIRNEHRPGTTNRYTRRIS
jgi:hypothetical protein